MLLKVIAVDKYYEPSFRPVAVATFFLADWMFS